MENTNTLVAALTSIGNAIRDKNGTETLYKPNEMANAIADLSIKEKSLSELKTAIISKYLSSSSYLDLSPYVDDFSKIKWIIATTGSALDGTYQNIYIWSSNFGTKYCIQAGGEKNQAINNYMGCSYQITDDGTPIKVNSYSTGPQCYIDQNGTSFAINNGSRSWTSTVYCHIFYEE